MRFAKNIAVTVLWVVATTTQLTFAQTENPSLHGQQVQLPNDVEQKASYCLAVAKLSYTQFEAIFVDIESMWKSATDPDSRRRREKSVRMTKQALEQIQDNINRLRSFLLPRLPYLEPTSMLSAYYRGKADFSRQEKSVKGKECDARCKNTEGNQRVSCMKECMEEDELNRRIFQCNDLSFLPY
ncbi:MAG: hypothetical protein MN733_00630 [Nitrososphaera sp.]|nr:hypothetical protein [Nitrososphaera sp.]